MNSWMLTLKKVKTFSLFRFPQLSSLFSPNNSPILPNSVCHFGETLLSLFGYLNPFHTVAKPFYGFRLAFERKVWTQSFAQIQALQKTVSAFETESFPLEEQKAVSSSNLHLFCIPPSLHFISLVPHLNNHSLTSQHSFAFQVKRKTCKFLLFLFLFHFSQFSQRVFCRN